MIHEKDMATSRAEFFRNLDVALRGMDYAVDGDLVTVEDGGKRIDVQLSPLPPRVLSALIKLERWKVSFEFAGFGEGEAEAFIARFDRAFQRGGG